jgi:hypothetical protein
MFDSSDDDDDNESSSSSTTSQSDDQITVKKLIVIANSLKFQFNKSSETSWEDKPRNRLMLIAGQKAKRPSTA